MGVKNLSSVLPENSKVTRKIENLSDRTIGFDAFNILFQFLASIRTTDGQSMSDDDGNVTSHLIGILTRGSNLIQNGITPVFVFDGKSHQFKDKEKQKRRDARDLAQIEYEKAIADGNMERARMFAKRVNKLTPEMVDDAKKLLDAMGIPVVQAPGEGEAQAAQLTIEGKLHATSSQDYDTLMFGSPILIRNLSVSGTRRLKGGKTIKVYPEEYSLNTVLQSLEIDRDQLVDLGIMMGTDFNDGFPGVGPKTAIKFIKKYGSYYKTRENEKKISDIDIPYEEIRDIFLKPNVSKNLDLDFSRTYSEERITEFLQERNFDIGRYINTIRKTTKMISKRETQTSLDDFF